MIHLSSLLLHLQYCYLFIIFIIFIFTIYLFFHFFFFSYLLSIYILSSQYRYSVVNVVLIINDSLIFFAPSSPIRSVHCILLVTCRSYYYYFLVILPLKFNDVHGVMDNTISMYSISSPVLTFHFIIIS